MDTFLAIIPAKLKSRSFPGKNIKALMGKPMFLWSVESALNATSISSVVVSSDSSEIKRMCERADVSCFLRPKKLAQDDSSISDVALNLLKELRKKEGKRADYTVILQPTSPLRTAVDIDNAVSCLLSSDADALVSGYKTEKNYLKAFFIRDNGFLAGVRNDSDSFMSRQFLPETFYPNGAIFIIKTSVLVKNKSLFTNKTIPFFMRKEVSVDIDNINDFRYAENFLKNSLQKNANKENN